MIILDMNQVMFSNLMQQIDPTKTVRVEEDLLRHMILNSIRALNVKYRNTYGELVIAVDSRKSWRKEVFPYYKANRQKTREKSKLDWNSVFESMAKICAEIEENFPYRVVQVDGAEGDDVIAVLAKRNASEGILTLIVSGDKDFRQLHNMSSVRQYDPVRKKMIEEDNPERYLEEHILQGDRGDGVPNFLSCDDVFVVAGKRQKPLRQKAIDEWFQGFRSQLEDPTIAKQYARNRAMIDLSRIPQHITDAIIERFNQQAGKNKSKVFNYMVDHRLKLLLADIDHF